MVHEMHCWFIPFNCLTLKIASEARGSLLFNIFNIYIFQYIQYIWLWQLAEDRMIYPWLKVCPQKKLHWRSQIPQSAPCLIFSHHLRTDLLHREVPEPGNKAGWPIRREMGGIARYEIPQDCSVLSGAWWISCTAGGWRRKCVLHRICQQGRGWRVQ